MTYTVWSRGRLLGHSTLGYARAAPGMRAGDFEPTPLGETLMPILTGVGPALNTLHRVAADLRTDAMSQADGDPALGFSPLVRSTTEYADAVSLVDELESLALELREPDGVVVRTEMIAVNDTAHLRALAREPLYDDDDLPPDEDEPLDPELEAAIAHDLEVIRSWEFEDDGEEWRDPPPIARYQLLVVLEGGITGTLTRQAGAD